MGKKRYYYIFRNEPHLIGINKISTLIKVFEGHIETFKKWQEKGIKIQKQNETILDDNYIEFYTDDEKVAQEEGFLYYGDYQ